MKYEIGGIDPLPYEKKLPSKYLALLGLSLINLIKFINKGHDILTIFIYFNLFSNEILTIIIMGSICYGVYVSFYLLLLLLVLFLSPFPFFFFRNLEKTQHLCSFCMIPKKFLTLCKSAISFFF